MSRKHPVIAVTGSSGAGTTTIRCAFEQIFRRESITAATLEGDSFHSVTRAEFSAAVRLAEQNRHRPPQPFRPGMQPFRQDRGSLPPLRRNRHMPAPPLHPQ